MRRPLLHAVDPVSKGVRLASDPDITPSIPLICPHCSTSVHVRSRQTPHGLVRWFVHRQANTSCEDTRKARGQIQTRALYMTPLFNPMSAMSQFFDQPIFESPVEKRNFSLKQATSAQLQSYVSYANALNKKRVEAETANQPGKTAMRAATLDESAVVERILEGVFARDAGFQAFLASGDVQLDATPKRRRSKQ